MQQAHRVNIPAPPGFRLQVFQAGPYFLITDLYGVVTQNLSNIPLISFELGQG